ncbi:hypothetical protein MG296_10530 [Flavobacteriaceae bacterium TK19130]|nr:hypothetical protein [Thermobacterium salinum]
MENDMFSTINNYLRSMPEFVHELTWIILMALYAHLLFGAWIERKKMKSHVKAYMIIRATIMLFYLCVKAVDVRYGMFDLFLPIYILFYVDGLVIVKGYQFHRCDSFIKAFRRVTKFSSKK